MYPNLGIEPRGGVHPVASIILSRTVSVSVCLEVA